MANESRIDSEWLTINAVREILKIATHGDMAKSTYDSAMEFGANIYPEMLGPDVSLLRRERESETAREYRQRATLLSIQESREVSPAELITTEISVIEGLLKVAKSEGGNKNKVDQLRRKLTDLKYAKDEISLEKHSENQLIFRDAYNVERSVPEMGSGKAYKTYRLPNSNALRVRVLHPDIPEQVTGADVIYERHAPYSAEASVVAIQYKIWEEKLLRLTDKRMLGQLEKLEDFSCKSGLCNPPEGSESYRFPHCSAFIRPTDKLQNPNQKLISSGEHLPICKIGQCTDQTDRGVDVLTYKSIRGTSLSAGPFEYLFNEGRIGSRMISYSDLAELYKKYEIAASAERVIIHAQEFDDAWSV